VLWPYKAWKWSCGFHVVAERERLALAPASAVYAMAPFSRFAQPWPTRHAISCSLIGRVSVALTHSSY
jgi:hypothetical protein